MNNNRLQSIRPSYFGMGALFSWLCCAWLTPSIFPIEAIGTEQVSLAVIVFAFTGALFFFAIPLIVKKHSLYGSTWLLVLSGILIPAGSVCMKLLFDAGAPFFSVLICSALLGFAYAIQCLMWGELCDAWDDMIAELALPLSSFLVPVFMFVVFNMTPLAANVVIAVLGASSSILLYLLRDEAPAADSLVILPPEESTMFWKDHLRIGLGTAIFFATLCCIWIMNPQLFFIMDPNTQISPFIPGSIAGTIAVLLVVQFSHRNNLFSIYRWMVPCIVISLCLLCLSGQSERLFGALLLCFICQMFYLMICLFSTRVSKHRWRRPSVCVGVNRGAILLGAGVGTLVGTALGESVVSDSLSVYLALICINIVVYTFVLNRQTRYERRSHLSIDTPDARFSVHSANATDEISSFDQPMPRRTVDTICIEIAEQAGLSAREVEVFALLARGRTLTYIRDELCISKNTVDTHTRHIYQKLDIHSKQELLSLVEERMSVEM